MDYIFNNLSFSAQKTQVKHAIGMIANLVSYQAISDEIVLCKVEIEGEIKDIKLRLDLLSQPYPNHQYHVFQDSNNCYLVCSNVMTGHLYHYTKLKSDRKRKQPDFKKMSCVFIGNYDDISVVKIKKEFNNPTIIIN